MDEREHWEKGVCNCPVRESSASWVRRRPAGSDRRSLPKPAGRWRPQGLELPSNFKTR